MSTPLVSVIVTTRNNRATLDACLASIQAQTYSPWELIVVDNDSRDGTRDIARRYTDKVFNEGTERSAQRNYAFSKARGEFVLVVDSDMELDENVVSSCVEAVQRDPGVRAVIIPEESIGVGFWARCKRLERSFYVGQHSIEAPRFFDKDLLRSVGGYSQELAAGEDWDLSYRIAAVTKVGRASALICHDEGRLSLGKAMRKKYDYAEYAGAYLARNPTKSALTDASGPLARYKLFLSRPGKLLEDPVVGAGMLFMKTAEYAAGGLGYLRARRRAPRS